MKKALAWLPALLWMGLIFALSAETGDRSGAQSGAVLRYLLAALSGICPGLSRIPTDTLHLILRKAAHMAAYAVLALLYMRPLRLCGAKRPAVCAFLLACVYAAADECHQSFVPGRGPSALDVLIDAAGAGAALAASHALRRLNK